MISLFFTIESQYLCDFWWWATVTPCEQYSDDAPGMIQRAEVMIHNFDAHLVQYSSIYRFLAITHYGFLLTLEKVG